MACDVQHLCGCPTLRCKLYKGACVNLDFATPLLSFYKVATADAKHCQEKNIKQHIESGIGDGNASRHGQQAPVLHGSSWTRT
jgi:hypothetical protein